MLGQHHSNWQDSFPSFEIFFSWLLVFFRMRTSQAYFFCFASFRSFCFDFLFVFKEERDSVYVCEKGKEKNFEREQEN